MLGKPQKVDLALELRVLAEQSLTRGVLGTIHRPNTVTAAAETLHRALSSTDEGYRAMGTAIALRMLADALSPPPPPPRTPLPPRPPPAASHSPHPLQVNCPNCRNGTLFQTGGGYPLPVKCHSCSYSGHIS